jgi:copper chaperone
VADTVIRVEGMTCEHCVKTVTQALLALPGVESAKVDLARGTASVTYDGSRVSSDQLTRTIRSAGYQAG